MRGVASIGEAQECELGGLANGAGVLALADEFSEALEDGDGGVDLGVVAGDPGGGLVYASAVGD